MQIFLQCARLEKCLYLCDYFSSQDASGGGCLEISLGLHIQVMYANVGALGNPQPKVIGVNYKWEEPQDIFFQVCGFVPFKIAIVNLLSE